MATIQDVAKLAGVTPTTVSRCINNRGYISDITRKKIYDAMDSLSYRPNELARSLSMQRTNTIGVIVPHIAHPYFAELISHLENKANQFGYKVLLCSSHESDEKRQEYLTLCQSNRVSGIIICSESVSGDAISKMGIPVVQIEKSSDVFIPRVLCDNVSGGAMATQALIDAGCKNLIHIGGVIDEKMPADARANEFARICSLNNVKHSEFRYPLSLYNTMDYIDFIRNLLIENPDVDGIFASSDLIACQVNSVCHQMGINIPKDIKLVGFDDIYMSKLSIPAITTIHQPLEEMAQMAISIIDDACHDRAYPIETIFPVTLIHRDSV